MCPTWEEGGQYLASTTWTPAGIEIEVLSLTSLTQLAEIGFEREAMLDTAVQGHLVRDLHPTQDVLRLPALRRRQKVVMLCGDSAHMPVRLRKALTSGSDAQRTSNAFQLLWSHCGRVREEASINTFAFGHRTTDVLRSQAVAYRAQLFHSNVTSQALDDLAGDRHNALRRVLLHPRPKWEAGSRVPVEWDIVALPDVRDHCEVAVLCKLVRDATGRSALSVDRRPWRWQ